MPRVAPRAGGADGACTARAAALRRAPADASLSADFLARVPDDKRARFAAVPDLEIVLADLVAAGQRAWPEIRLAPRELLVFLAPLVPAEAAADLSSLRAGDLHLVRAYGLGVAGAVAALETHCMSRVATALERLGTPAATIADIQQDLRQHLVEMQTAPRARQGYAGRGDLSSWLCVSAVRAAGRRRDRARRERPLEDLAELISPEHDPEVLQLRTTCKQELEAALEQALASLTSRERNILHYHFVERLSIDQIGGFYGVHRATAARWIERTREALSQRTRELLAQRVSLSQDGFRRMLSLIQSQISVLLGPRPGTMEEPPPPAP